MKTSFLHLLSVTLLSNTVFAQNLVQNPSFEEYLDCPQSTAGLHTQVENWYSWAYTPDYFNECNNSGLGTAGVPNNAWGSQSPITGVAYAGVYTYAEYALDIREYMATPLLQPLVQGETYYVMFHASMFDGAEKETRLCAINNIGLRFFQDPDYNNTNNPFTPDNFAHLNYTEILNDSENWTKIDGYVTADQSYDWLAIGNFYTDDQSDILILNDEKNCSGIYYIENVCIGLSPEDCDYLLNARNIEAHVNIDVFPNPTTDILNIKTEIPIERITVIDMNGKEILSSRNQILDVSNLPNGVYIVHVTTEEGLQRRKFIKN